MSKILNFSILLIFLSIFDFATTSYALQHGIGYESNPIMATVTASTILFLLVKAIGITVIIGMYKSISKKSEKIAQIGQTIIIGLMLFVVTNNILIISANAVEFPAIGQNGHSGSIGTGNGYFTDDAASYNTTADTNIYAVAEYSNISLLEPIGYSLGTSDAVTIIHANNNDLRFAMVSSDGYLYFSDSQGLKRKKSRSDTLSPEARDTVQPSGGVLMIYSATDIYQFSEIGGVIYFRTGTSIRSFAVSDLIVSTYKSGLAVSNQDMVVAVQNGSQIELYYSSTSGTFVSLTRIQSGNVYLVDSTTVGTNQRISLIGTQSYIILINSSSPTNSSTDRVYYISNSTFKSQGTMFSSVVTAGVNASFSVSGLSTIGMYATSPTLYNIFNSIQPGTNIPAGTTQAALSYVTSEVDSIYNTYYNNSNFYINYKVIADNPIFTGMNVWKWKIVLYDPNNVAIYQFYSPNCQFIGILGLTCGVNETKILSPEHDWTPGIWKAKLYEYNVVTQEIALLDVSSPWTVLNASESQNASAVGLSETDIYSNGGADTIGQIDSMVLWLGLGQNQVSKFLFALIWIGVFAIFGMKYGGNVSMTGAFIPYIFFTYIEYIPKWVFIIVVVMMISIAKVFR